MLSQPSLFKLLSHLPPARFSGWITATTGETAPADLPIAVRPVRSLLRGWLESFDALTLDRLEHFAERILLLSDRLGCEVLSGLRCALTDDARAQFEAQTDQYQRALWLSEYDATCFEQALEARDAEAMRAKVRFWTGFLAPAGLNALHDATSRSQLTVRMAELLGLSPDHVAIQVFLRNRGISRLIQISVHYNRPSELFDHVIEGELTHTTLVRALAAYVTYEPESGHLEVLSPTAEHREGIARGVADTLLKCAFDVAPLPLKHFDYQVLAKPLELDLRAAPEVMSAVVSSLGYRSFRRQLNFAIPATEKLSIHAAASQSIQQHFVFAEHSLNAAKIRLRLRPTRDSRARTITIQLADTHRCNTKSMRDADRALCDRLLAQWHLVRMVASNDPSAGHAEAA